MIGKNGQLTQNARSLQSINNSNYLYSGSIEVFAFENYTTDATVHILQPYPFPLTINSISLDVTIGDLND